MKHRILTLIASLAFTTGTFAAAKTAEAPAFSYTKATPEEIILRAAIDKALCKVVVPKGYIMSYTWYTLKNGEIIVKHSFHKANKDGSFTYGK